MMICSDFEIMNLYNIQQARSPLSSDICKWTKFKVNKLKTYYFDSHLTKDHQVGAAGV